MALSNTRMIRRLTMVAIAMVGMISDASAAGLSGTSNATASTTIISLEPAPRLLAARASEPVIAALDGNDRLLSVASIEAAPATSHAPIVFAYN